jgi:hypothetical protein
VHRYRTGGNKSGNTGQREIGIHVAFFTVISASYVHDNACGVARGPELEHLRQELWNSEPRDAIGGSLQQGSSILSCIGRLHYKEYSLGAEGNGKNPDTARARPLHL